MLYAAVKLCIAIKLIVPAFFVIRCNMDRCAADTGFHFTNELLFCQVAVINVGFSEIVLVYGIKYGKILIFHKIASLFSKQCEKRKRK